MAKKSEATTAKIEGKCKWAAVLKPNTMFEPQWCIDIIIENPELASRLSAAGIAVKEDRDGDTVIKIKRKTHKKSGEPAKPPVVVFEDGSPVEELIGNGSTVVVDFLVYDWSSFGKSGKGTYLNKVTVKDFIPYGEEKPTLDFTEGTATDVPF